MKAIDIKIEYLSNPTGLGIADPRISWICDSGVTQTAYRVIAIKNGIGAGDTGKVSGSHMHVMYDAVSGTMLQSRDRVEIRITLWDENDVAGETSTTVFEMGLMNRNDLTASWITGNYRVDPRRRYPADHFRKCFAAADIKKARLYITSCGLYAAYINGNRVGDFVMAPGHTDARKKVQLQTYDVTDMIRTGENTIEAVLGDGWYRGSCGVEGIRNNFGTETKLLAQLELTDSEGRIRTIATGSDWEWSNDGPIRQMDNMEGEIIDFRMSPSYHGGAKEVRHVKTVPVASNNVPVREHEHFPGEIFTTPAGKKVVDFRQNIAGYVRLRFQAEEGQKISLKFGEKLDDDGEFTQSNLMIPGKERPFQRVEITAKKGRNDYKPLFCVFGFQYVEIEGLTDEAFYIEAIAVYSDLRQTMTFSCSNELINRFVACTGWSFKNNSLDIPTDCPTRERSGWTGDAGISLGTALYFFDYTAFSRKFVRDMQDEQQKSGCYTQIAPVCGDNKWMRTLNNSPGWADAGVIIPYRLYRHTGDIRFLAENYDSMRRFAEYRYRQIGKPSILVGPICIGLKNRLKIVADGQGYGEWAEPAEIAPINAMTFIKPHVEENTAYACYTLELMSEIADLLDKKEDSARYKKASEKVKDGYQHLVETKAYSLDTDRQCRLVRPLYMNLLNEEQTKFARGRLIEALEHYDWRVGTGFLSTPMVLSVLNDIDSELAFRLLENEQMPGWLYMPKSGATTIWESWEGLKAAGDVASLDHYSKGAVCEWIFENIGGIRIIGENRFLIHPLVGGTLSDCRCEYESPYGKVIVCWTRIDSGVQYDITIPPNCTAEIRLGDGRAETVSAGKQVTYTRRA